MLDAQQRQLAARLADLGPPPRSLRGSSRGLYIYGPAGRGKSWLADAFFDAVPTRRKARVHFHSFFDDLHRHIHDHRDDHRALRRAMDDVTGHSSLLLFDELHVHDSGDARLLTRLLEHVFDRKIAVVATSNYAPDSLLPNPIWHHIFEPGITLIKMHLDTFNLTGATDYRAVAQTNATGFAAGEWTTGTSHPHGSYEPTFLAVRGRHFPVLSVRPGRLSATFAQLCAAPVSAIEYLEWARTYERWVISEIPRFDDMDPEAQQRFINLVDILVEIDVRVSFVSPHSLPEFLTAATDHRPDAFRMSSRMQLVRHC
ncbi:cell division protein ZapE [Williamsia limnetica]|uniref:Cell division protein ZapE n=1 Tax=Williamsia limnetica TaxID=882452 RepID=A0A318RKW3_WILLI|nr:cell division protein ZapE [Williamsia limnetica]